MTIVHVRRAAETKVLWRLRSDRSKATWTQRRTEHAVSTFSGEATATVYLIPDAR